MMNELKVCEQHKQSTKKCTEKGVAGAHKLN